MEIKTTIRKGINIVEITGNLDGNSAPQLQESAMPLIVPDGDLILDFSGCRYVSSAGLRVLLMIAKQLPAQGGQLALSGLLEEVKDVMDMTGFSHFFKIFETVEEAAAALTQARKK
jgi:anti-anti-sigma factor